jgi:hypothetical protein
MTKVQKSFWKAVLIGISAGFITVFGLEALAHLAKNPQEYSTMIGWLGGSAWSFTYFGILLKDKTIGNNKEDEKQIN